MVPGQDLSIGLQALLVWLETTDICPIELQQELIWEPGQLDIGVVRFKPHRMAEGWQPCRVSLGVGNAQHVHVDETPWPVMGIKEWLWVAAGKDFCLFHAGIPCAQ